MKKLFAVLILAGLLCADSGARDLELLDRGKSLGAWGIGIGYAGSSFSAGQSGSLQDSLGHGLEIFAHADMHWGPEAA